MYVYCGIAFSLFFAILLCSIPAQTTSASAFTALLLIALAYASYVDLRRFEIPDLVSIGLFPLGVTLWLTCEPEAALPHVLAGLGALCLFYAFSRAFFFFRRYEGLGLGDIKLIASATVWIGLANLPVMILIAAISGLIASFYNFDKKKLGSQEAWVPFGPHLAIAIALVWFGSNLNLLDLLFLGNFE